MVIQAQNISVESKSNGVTSLSKDIILKICAQRKKFILSNSITLKIPMLFVNICGDCVENGTKCYHFAKDETSSNPNQCSCGHLNNKHIPTAPAELFKYSCVIKNSKIRKCCRLKVYKAAEKCHAKVINGEIGDGIYYVGDSKDLTVQLIFKDERQAEDFQSVIMGIPFEYRKRKLPEHFLGDISVVDNGIVRLYGRETGAHLIRIFGCQYAKLDEDDDPSEDCDGESEMRESYISTVYLTETVKLQLVDNPNSSAMYRTTPDKCHLKSQSKYPQHASNPNNIVFMSRFLHEHFDGINKINKVPTFLMKYMSHNSESISMVLDGMDVIVYETLVRFVFKTIDDKNTLCPFFRPHTVVNDVNIELNLFFEDPAQFKIFCDHKELITLRIWAQVGEDD